MAMFTHLFEILKNIFFKSVFPYIRHIDLNFTVLKFHFNTMYGLGSMANPKMLILTILQCNYTVLYSKTLGLDRCDTKNMLLLKKGPTKMAETF